jgi:hypothetical protein
MIARMTEREFEVVSEGGRIVFNAARIHASAQNVEADSSFDRRAAFPHEYLSRLIATDRGKTPL